MLRSEQVSDGMVKLYEAYNDYHKKVDERTMKKISKKSTPKQYGMSLQRKRGKR